MPEEIKNFMNQENLKLEQIDTIQLKPDSSSKLSKINEKY